MAASDWPPVIEYQARQMVYSDAGETPMLTFFTTAKPFRGHSGVIQRNALKSWTLLHPDVEGDLVRR
jgi:hypothetical protein